MDQTPPEDAVGPEDVSQCDTKVLRDGLQLLAVPMNPLEEFLDMARNMGSLGVAQEGQQAKNLGVGNEQVEQLIKGAKNVIVG